MEGEVDLGGSELDTRAVAGDRLSDCIDQLTHGTVS
jgi:hypothetical protein